MPARLLIATWLTLATVAVVAQEPHQSGVTAILVDVVVRERDGTPITDLREADFEIYEEGVRQTVGAFTRVTRSDGIGIGLGTKEPGPTTVIQSPDAAVEPPESDPPITAFVFDALSPEALGICKRAALRALPKDGTAKGRIGVFATEPVVHTLQEYTDDPALVGRAVQQVSATGTIAHEQQRERLDVLRARRKEIDALAIGASAAQSPAGGLQASAAGNIGQVEIERRLLRAEQSMLRAFETLDRDHRGLGTSNALLSIVHSLTFLPGRKAVVFFSEGLPASPAMQGHLQSVVEAANRRNVTVYAVDASGLRALSIESDSRKQLEEVVDQRLRQLGAGDEALDRPILQLVERTEDMMRFGPHSGLTRLAEETGGFLVRDTNDVGRAFRRIDEDMRFHYLLTYSPVNQAFDGKFRTIEVKVKQPGVRVFARKGYRALRRPSSLPVLSYEARALAALDGPELPNAFPFVSAAFSFPDPLHPGLAALVVRVRTNALTYDQDFHAETYGADAAIVVRLKDAAGHVRHKTSQQYQLAGRLHELEGARRGEILFYRQPELDPGVYTVEAVIFDSRGNRGSARVSTLEVPPPAEHRVQVSSLVLIKDVERMPQEEEAAEAHPLYVSDLLLYPSAGEPFSRREDKELTFFYTVYTGGRLHTSLRAALELRSSGQLLKRLPAELSTPDAHNRIQQLNRLPLAPLTPGSYELRLVVREAQRVLERSTFFKVIE